MRTVRVFMGEPGVCGNGVVEALEACEDGNSSDGDCCSATCQFEYAGSACPGDATSCTRDECDGAGACVHPADIFPSCKTPTAARASRLQLVNRVGTNREALSWRWSKGQSTHLSEFGNLLTGGALELCVFAGSGPAATTVAHASVPGGGICSGKSCWQLNGFSRLRYKNATRPDGIGRAMLKAGSANDASIQVHGFGPNLTLPPMPSQLPLRVQLRATGGSCFEASYSAAGVSKNEAGRLGALSD